MRAFFVFAAIAAFGCSSTDTSSTGSTALAEPAPKAQAVTVCTYPDGPYGKEVGKTIPPTLTWSGLGPGGQPTTYKSTDFFDCDGTKGINAIVFDSSATWCGACQAEASELEGIIKSNWGANGVAVITLMVEDANHKPPSDVSVAQDWMKQFHLNNVPVAINPTFDFAVYTNGSLGLPYNVLVNPRNMQVIKSPYNPGAGGHDGAMDALLAANQAQ
jgi:thiol-disulfide isomerase/thioredoxin